MDGSIIVFFWNLFVVRSSEVCSLSVLLKFVLCLHTTPLDDFISMTSHCIKRCIKRCDVMQLSLEALSYIFRFKQADAESHLCTAKRSHIWGGHMDHTDDKNITTILKAVGHGCIYVDFAAVTVLYR